MQNFKENPTSVSVADTLVADTADTLVADTLVAGT